MKAEDMKPGMRVRVDAADYEGVGTLIGPQNPPKLYNKQPLWCVRVDSAEGHDCEGLCPESDGWWVNPKDCELLVEVPKALLDFRHDDDGLKIHEAHVWSESTGPVEAQTEDGTAHLLPEDAAERKKFPIFDGFLNYFPQACLLASRVSFESNEQHNPGEPLHWAREKSADHRNAEMRHAMESAKTTDAKKKAWLAAQAFWRAAAECELAIEAAGGLAAMYPGEEE